VNRILVVAALVAALPAAAQNNKPRVTSGDAAKKAGLELQKTLDADIDGDGKKDLVAMANAVGEKGGPLWIVVLGEDENGYVVRDRVKVGGKEFKKFEAAALVPAPDAMEVIVEVYDDNPDEKVKRVHVFSGVPRLREIFKSAIFRPKDKDAREEWEKDADLVQYGDARPGWYFQDLEGDGITEIMVRRKPQVLEVPRDDKKAKLLTGVREAVFAFDGSPDQGVYVERAGGRFNDFLPAYAVKDVEASSAWVDPKVLKDLKAQALSSAATAAATGGGKTDTDVDLKPYMVVAADKNLETAWIEDSKTQGKGEWIEVKLDADHAIHMVRVVPGCVADKRQYGSHNVPESIEIQLGSGSRAKVDLKKTKDVDRPAIAVQELPVKDRGWAKQYLVFFEGKDNADSVKVYLDGAKKQGAGNHTCISEVSVH
jgi:hypothetical protein